MRGFSRCQRRNVSSTQLMSYKQNPEFIKLMCLYIFRCVVLTTGSMFDWKTKETYSWETIKQIVIVGGRISNLKCTKRGVLFEGFKHLVERWQLPLMYIDRRTCNSYLRCSISPSVFVTSPVRIQALRILNIRQAFPWRLGWPFFYHPGALGW